MRRLLSLGIILLFIATLFKLQNPAYTGNGNFIKGIYAVFHQSFTTETPANTPHPEQPQNHRDLLRLEIFLLVLFLLSFFSFLFSVYLLPFTKIRIPIEVTKHISFIQKLSNRAPPILISRS